MMLIMNLVLLILYIRQIIQYCLINNQYYRLFNCQNGMKINRQMFLSMPICMQHGNVNGNGSLVEWVPVTQSEIGWQHGAGSAKTFALQLHTMLPI